MEDAQHHAKALSGEIQISSSVTVLVKTHFWVKWARVAIRQERRSLDVRERLQRDPSMRDLIWLESEEGLVAITASAFALDALFGELASIVAPELAELWKKGARTARHRQVYEVLKRATTMNTNVWPEEFEWLIAHRRGKAVHYKGQMTEPVLHPIPELGRIESDTALYLSESATKAVDVVIRASSACIENPKPASREWANGLRHIPSMIREFRSTGEDF